jgi:DNA-binding transcriptional ArsR family regulator
VVADIDAVLVAVADRSRRRLLQRLAHGPATTGQLAELLPMTRPAVSQHIKLLQEAGLIHTTTVGRHRWHELAPAPLTLIERWAADVAARHARAPALQVPATAPVGKAAP